MDKRLTKNFTLGEMIRSYQAEKRGINNKPSKEAVENLKNLCTCVLQPLRDFHRRSILVSSGYRCRTLNRVVGGASTSQHMLGEAADIVFPNFLVALDWMHFISHNCPFDQLLLEQNRRNGARWLHVSCCKDTSRNRREINIIQVG